MPDLPRRKHSDVLRAHLPMKGRIILDVGCGDGALVRFLARQGAWPIGIECSQVQMDRARAALPVANECYVFARGEALPFAGASSDGVVFFNSLHHVPVADQGRALEEAARVLRPGGLVYVMEPMAEGPHFDLMQPVEDETDVRAAAGAALHAASDAAKLHAELEESYVSAMTYEDFPSFKTHILAVDPGRRAAFEGAEPDLQEAFKKYAQWCDGAWYIDQPYRLNLLTRPA